MESREDYDKFRKELNLLLMGGGILLGRMIGTFLIYCQIQMTREEL